MAGTLLNLLNWIWVRLDVITGVLAIPWGLLLVSLAITGWRKFIVTSGADIYVILSSLDLEFIVFKDRFVGLVYKGIQAKFSEVFVVGLLISFFFLALSSRAQRLTTGRGHHSTNTSFLCWTVAPVWMAIHFFAILAR
jgi:hypothetical protein